MKSWIFILIILGLFVSPILGISQPSDSDPLEKKGIVYSVAGGSIVGESCTNQYKISGSYCSGNIRQYFQCLPSVSGLTWQQRSENCGDYNYICYAGDCVESSTSNVFMQNILLIVGIIIAVLIAFWLGMRRR